MTQRSPSKNQQGTKRANDDLADQDDSRKRPNTRISPYICVVCKQPCLEENISCSSNSCNNTFHLTCVAMTKIYHEFFIVKKKQSWKCPLCETKSLEDLKSANNEFMSKLNKMQSDVDTFNNRVDICEMKLTSYNSQMKILVDTVSKTNEMYDTKIDEISSKVNNQDEKLQKEICFIQGMQNQDELIINGVPQTEKENLSFIIIKIAAALNINITSDRIKKIYRMGPQAENTITNAQKNKPILVKFNTTETRNLINSNYVQNLIEKKPLTLNNIGIPSNERVYINPHLPKCLTPLYKKALDMKKRNLINAVHAKINSIAIKIDNKWHKIQTEKELEETMEKGNKVGHSAGANVDFDLLT